MWCRGFPTWGKVANRERLTGPRLGDYVRVADIVDMTSPGSLVSGGGKSARDPSARFASDLPASGIVEAGNRSRTYWCGVVANTWWFYFTGSSTNEIWYAYIDHCKAMLASGAERPSLVCIAHHADSPSGDQRRLIGDFINSEFQRLGSLVGFVLVLDSPLHILALKAINWLAKKPFPENVCGSPGTAASWLRDLGAPIDGQMLIGAIEAAVPPEHHWTA